MLLKQRLLIQLDCILSVSFPISVFFTHSLRDVLRKGQGTVSKRRGLLAYVHTMTSTANFWAQIIFDPYRRPLTLTFLLVSKRGLFQDTMFDRLHYSTLSEDASEVLVQPLYCGTFILQYLNCNRIKLCFNLYSCRSFCFIEDLRNIK